MMFSVIVPVFNVASYIRECIDSVLAQSCDDFEVVCVDDGSTDGSGQILDDYARRDGRVRVLHCPNQGVSAARNAALDIAAGEWVTFLDADDLLSPSFLADARALISDSGIDLVRFRQYRFKDGGNIGFDDLKEVPAEIQIDLSSSIPFDVLERGFLGVVYRRAVMGQVRFRSYVMGEDRLYYAQCLLQCRSMVDVNRSEYGYRVRDGSAMHGVKSARKSRDAVVSSIRRMAVLLFSRKRIPFRVYRRAIGGLVSAVMS